MTKTPIPTSADELEEMLADGRVADLFEAGKPTDQFGEFVRNYASAQQGKGTDIAAQVREETQRVVAEMLREHGGDGVRRVNLSPGDAKGTAANALHNPKAPGARVDQIVTDHGEYLRNVWYRNESPEARDLQNKLRSIRNDYGSSIPADGGFLIPETLRSTLLQVAMETAIVRPRATVIPMESLRVPFPTVESTNHAGSVYGGMIGYWTQESGNLTESQAKFGRLVLEAMKLTGYSEVPNELFQDSIISFQAFLSKVWPEAIAWFEDLAFMAGTGVGEPLGWLNAAAAATVTKEASQAADTVLWANIVKMYSRMLPASLGKAVWIANIDVFPQLAQMTVNVKNVAGTENVGGSAVWINNGAEGPPMTILGRPVIFTEKAPTVGDVGDLNLVDLSYYLIGDRQAMSMETSTHYKFGQDQTAVRIIQRVDGRPWLQSAITPAKGSNTLSPFVKIEAR